MPTLDEATHHNSLKVEALGALLVVRLALANRLRVESFGEDWFEKAPGIVLLDTYNRLYMQFTTSSRVMQVQVWKHLCCCHVAAAEPQAYLGLPVPRMCSMQLLVRMLPDDSMNVHAHIATGIIGAGTDITIFKTAMSFKRKIEAQARKHQ